jgi:hypothetical protein
MKKENDANTLTTTVRQKLKIKPISNATDALTTTQVAWLFCAGTSLM